MGDKLYVTTLGQFSMRYPTYEGPGIISNQESTSWRMWAFLQYLCTFHDRAVTQEEIFDVLWNDIGSANPASTVKTLLHRSRLLMEKLGFPDGKQVLRYRRGLYSWDPDLVVWTDTDEFDRLCVKFYAEPAGESSLEAARNAIALYEGDFLPSAAGSPWALSPRTYYHTKFIRLCCDSAEALWGLGRLEEAIGVCGSATALDPYEESCHLLMMRLLQAAGSKQAAIQYYNDVSSLLQAQLGIPPSDELTALYRELSGASDSQALELDLRTIQTKLLDENQAAGALSFEYNVFRDIYSLVVRSALRSGQVVQLCLMTVLDQNEQPLPRNRRAAAIDELRSAIQNSCRSGDVFTQLSSAQFLLLLPAASYENANMAIKRVLSVYRSTLMGKTTTVRCSVMSALTPEQQKMPKTPKIAAAGKWKDLQEKKLV